MLPGDRLVCAFVEPQETGNQFTRWILHVTVVPWFRSQDSSESIALGLTKALVSIKPFEVLIDEEAWFGPKKNRKAHLVKTPSPLSDIEARVRNYFHKKRAWLVDETTKRSRRFRPHVTVQNNSSLKIGDRFNIGKLYIVEQKGNYKEIVAEVPLG